MNRFLYDRDLCLEKIELIMLILHVKTLQVIQIIDRIQLYTGFTTGTRKKISISSILKRT